MNKISQFPPLMGVVIKFVIFRPILCAKLALGHIDFMRPPVREGVSISYVQITKRWIAKVTIPGIKLTKGSRNRVKFREFEKLA